MLTRLIEKKRMTAFLFVLFLLVFSAVNMRKELPILGQAVTDWWEEGGDLGELVAGVNSAIEENVFGRYGFIDAYGYLQLLLGKEEESNFEVVKDTEEDSERKLHYTYFAEEINDTSELAERVAKLSGILEEEGSELLYIMPPEKFILGHTQFSEGLPYNMANETADDFLSR